MTPNQASYDLIRSFEGCKMAPYLDSNGKPTIGVGCTIYKSGNLVRMDDPPLTIEQMKALFEWQVSLKAAAVNGLHIIFNQNQFNALLSFCYNEGVGAMAKSTLIKKARVNSKDPSIAAEFAKYNKTSYIKDGKKIYITSEGLTIRRGKESDVYFTPI